jgi:hypothetical protein
MKKLTIKEYADILRAQYPNKTKGKSDIQIVSSWVNLYPEKVELLKLDQRALLTVDNFKKYTKKEYEKLKQKISPKKSTSPTPQTTDSTSDSTKTTTQQPIITPKPAQTQPVDSSVFNCIRNSNTKGKNLQQTKDNPEAYSFFNTDGSEFTFWANGDFTYYDGDTTANGKWKCKGGNNFEANVDWKGTTHYYKSETNEWALTQNAKKTVYENTIKKIVSKNLKSLVK